MTAPIAVRLDPERRPAEVARRFGDLRDACLLESAAHPHSLSRFSFFSADPVATIRSDAHEWPSVCKRIRSTFNSSLHTIAGLPPFQGGWMGWLSYELGEALDDVVPPRKSPTGMPDIALALHDWVIAWDHAANACWLISTGTAADGTIDHDRARQRAEMVLDRWQNDVPPQRRDGRTVAGASMSDFSADEYRTAVARVIEYVLAGDIFQANIAQRFSTPFDGDIAALYDAVVRRSPAPMAALIHCDDIAIVSASPERFLRLEAATGQVETRPIKGTRPRADDPARDAALALELQRSEKDRAENVMIVDLLRNDLSRVCAPGSVRATTLCAIESHATVHHLVSTVVGTVCSGRDALDVIAATFPGGSITGAPKLRAMEIIRELEPVPRGVYSGAIGWIGLDGSIDTSIAIRTIAIRDGAATVHAGGGITARSVPADEYQETLDKSAALLAAIAAAP